jgi:hypothetical protein
MRVISRSTNFQPARGRPPFAKLTALPVSTERAATSLTRPASNTDVEKVFSYCYCGTSRLRCWSCRHTHGRGKHADGGPGSGAHRENATVCGVVASTRYAAGTNGQPTYLNFDLPYPRQIFSVVIWGSDRPKFGTPETTLMGKRSCATGTIQSFRGKAEIIATDPRQLVVR